MDDAETGKLLEGCACLIVPLTMQATALSQEAGWQGSDVRVHGGKRPGGYLEGRRVSRQGNRRGITGGWRAHLRLVIMEG